MKKIKNILDSKNIQEKILFIAEVTHKDKAFILAHPELELSLTQLLRFYRYLHLYKKGYSVAVILHHKEFFGLDFYVNKNVLIPRPDTEMMVTEVLDKITEKDTLVDIGTGSGCVLISVLKNKKIINAYGLDISRKALKVARKNAKKHGVKAEFLKSDLLSTWDKIQTTGDIFITANLPYLTQKQFDTEPSIQREPHLALVANNDGLELYEKLLAQIKNIIGKKSVHLFLEIDPSQNEKIKKIVQTIFPDAQVEIQKDLAGLDRLAVIKM